MKRQHRKAIGSSPSKDVGEELFSHIESCATYYKNKKHPFVVIIDGLDHVWRDNDGDKSPLDDLFRQLVPVVDNMVLLIGTQPVDDAKLPTRLLQFCPRDTWYDLPFMSEAAIFDYMESQHLAGRFTDGKSHQDPISLLRKSAIAMHEKTGGYPLQVIYSCEYFVVNNTFPTEWFVNQLPDCKGQHIEHYYRSLWLSLTSQQKDILHICCALTQFWPQELF